MKPLLHSVSNQPSQIISPSQIDEENSETAEDMARKKKEKKILTEEEKKRKKMMKKEKVNHCFNFLIFSSVINV